MRKVFCFLLGLLAPSLLLAKPVGELPAEQSADHYYCIIVAAE